MRSTLRRSADRVYYMLKKSPLHDYWRLLEETQFMPNGWLRELQFRRLRALLSFAYDNNEFYRGRFDMAGLQPKILSDPSDIRKLPVLTKEEVRRNLPRMISRGFNIVNLQKAKTGGSTGKALELYFTEQCSELRNACARRHDRWTGWEPGEPIAACWGNPNLPRTLKEKFKQCALQPIIYLDTMSVNEVTVKAFAHEWKGVTPTLLFGHAHSIFILAQYVRGLRLQNMRPRGILTTSMMLMPHERRFIEGVFGIKVTDRYGCEEVSLIGCECEKHDGMHLNVEHLFIEFIREDGTPCKIGEPGRIVVTDLLNKAMPLIRYNVEDVGCPTDRLCSCGRGLPLMEQVTGRVADFLVKRDGTKVAGVSLIENSLTRFAGIDQMQIIQEEPEWIILNVVPGKGYSAIIGDHLKYYFKQVFGLNTAIDLELLQEIKPEKSGKHRFSICKVLSINSGQS